MRNYSSILVVVASLCLLITLVLAWCLAGVRSSAFMKRLFPNYQNLLKAHIESFPYATHLDILHAPLEVVDVQALVDRCTDRWYNQTLCQVNESIVRLGVIQGEYHWHQHTGDDEFFYVVDGRLLIDLEDRTVELAPRQGFVVPRGVRHRTRAPERTVILMVENAGIVPTGDVR